MKLTPTRFSPVYREDEATSFTDIQLKNGIYVDKKIALSRSNYKGDKPIYVLIMKIVRAWRKK